MSFNPMHKNKLLRMSLPWGFGDIYWINFYDLGGIVPHLTPMYIRVKGKGWT